MTSTSVGYRTLLCMARCPLGFGNTFRRRVRPLRSLLAALNTSLFVICVFASVAVSGGSYLSTQSTPKAYREALLTAMNSKLHAKSYRLKEIQSGAGEGVAVSTVTMGDYVAPDKYHATVETSSGNSVKSEVILLAGMAFARTAGGTWRRKQIDRQRIDLE